MSGIYMIENTRNGKKYIGSSKNIEKRRRQHFKDLDNGKHHSAKLQRSYNASKDKTIFVFSIIEEIDDITRLVEREQFYIDFYDSYTSGYNCSKLAERPCNTAKSDELKALYGEFFNLYDSEHMTIMPFLLRNINDRVYKKPMMKKIVAILSWFLDAGIAEGILYIEYEAGQISAWIKNHKGRIISAYSSKILAEAYDTNLLLKGSIISVGENGVVEWLDEKYSDTGNIFSKVKRACQTGRVRISDGCLVVI